MTANVDEARLRRLRWRCRRGTKELDALLGWWLEQRYAGAEEASQAAFDALLDRQDPDVWDWLMGYAVPEDPRWRAIVDEIRAHHRL
ncbi:MAG: succinate dehydrogenase assembly factor 2 [Mizugakiibacter sp.]|uniref:FAD assembly factor SdhE n=1 Tax=Mizugakiibacter sp. TaxID=1972610 RepID=UPI0031CB62AC|nr:succinate dehydrogenase assembly factor 2 [Xanthomonadaceae bacterium]